MFYWIKIKFLCSYGGLSTFGNCFYKNIYLIKIILIFWPCVVNECIVTDSVKQCKAKLCPKNINVPCGSLSSNLTVLGLHMTRGLTQKGEGTPKTAAPQILGCRLHSQAAVIFPSSKSPHICTYIYTKSSTLLLSIQVQHAGQVRNQT